MLNPSRKYDKVQDNLSKTVACIFGKQVFPHAGPNFRRSRPQVASKPDILDLQLADSRGTRNSISLLTKNSARQPKQRGEHHGACRQKCIRSLQEKISYKQSLDCLTEAVQLSQSQNADRELSSFYSDVIQRMIEIYDFGAFRRQYLMLIERVLNRYQPQIQNSYILKGLVQQRENLRDKVCIAKKRINFAQFSTSTGNSIKQSKFTLKMKQSRQESNEKSSREKSLSSSKKSSLFSPRSKFNSKELRSKQYINPYGLSYSESENNKCIFM